MEILYYALVVDRIDIQLSIVMKPVQVLTPKTNMVK